MTIEGTTLTTSHIGRAVVSHGCPCGVKHCGTIKSIGERMVMVQTAGGVTSCEPAYLHWLGPPSADEIERGAK